MPSLLSADFACLGSEAEAVIGLGATRLHFDVMDNHYVPNLTVGPLVLEALRRHGIRVPIEVHLMARPVDRLIPDFAEAGASVIFIHPEGTAHLDRSLALIAEHGCEAGIALNPATPPALLPYILERIEHVLVMTVNPGFAGQAFIPGVLPKIREIREWIDRSSRPLVLEVDGGIHPGTIRAAWDSGADRFVAGSAIFGSRDRVQAWRALHASLERDAGSEPVESQAARNLR
ncbi:ribulose-5-phosphate 3-epimerase [mine drainage metagenome]|uniref:ribulose-phosphate 3-epimerase n=1 Tax=mine drainage metagenome TaxID=410659 RepID=T1BFF0_9ZZZZ